MSPAWHDVTGSAGPPSQQAKKSPDDPGLVDGNEQTGAVLLRPRAQTVGVAAARRPPICRGPDGDRGCDLVRFSATYVRVAQRPLKGRTTNVCHGLDVLQPLATAVCIAAGAGPT
jgi:hypothetical protein